MSSYELDLLINNRKQHLLNEAEELRRGRMSDRNTLSPIGGLVGNRKHQHSLRSGPGKTF